MQKIVEYGILDYRSASSLTELVQSYIKDGWQPYGSPAISSEPDTDMPVIIQAMVRYEEADIGKQAN